MNGVQGCELNFSDSGPAYGPTTEYCEHGSHSSDFVRSGVFD
jgi:hypothetical protein